MVVALAVSSTSRGAAVSAVRRLSHIVRSPTHPLFFLLGLLIAVCPTMAADPAQDDYGAPSVQVTEKDGTWMIRGSQNRVELLASDLRMTVRTAGKTWPLLGSLPNDLVVEVSGKTYSLRLADAIEKSVSPYQTGFKTGLKVALRDFQNRSSSISRL